MRAVQLVRRRYQKGPPGEGLVREIRRGLQQHKGKGLLRNTIPNRQPHAAGGEGMQHSAPHIVLHGDFAVPAPKAKPVDLEGSRGQRRSPSFWRFWEGINLKLWPKRRHGKMHV